jgi:hypothetical protein
VIPTLRAIDRIRVTALVVLASCAALSAVARAEAVASGRAPALLMNLDEFDKAKQTVLLPYGITLGYV